MPPADSSVPTFFIESSIKISFSDNKKNTYHSRIDPIGLSCIFNNFLLIGEMVFYGTSHLAHFRYPWRQVAQRAIVIFLKVTLDLTIPRPPLSLIPLTRHFLAFFKHANENFIAWITKIIFLFKKNCQKNGCQLDLTILPLIGWYKHQIFMRAEIWRPVGAFPR